MSPEQPSFQDLQRKRQQEAFVGRSVECSRFEENLQLPPADPRRRCVIGIHGQAGMGKTSFLGRCRAIAEAAGCHTGLSDDQDVDLLEVMNTLAEGLDAEGAFLPLRTKLKEYREKRHELESSEGASSDMARAIASAAGRAGTKLARRIPLAGAAFDFVDEEDVGAALSDLATFVLKRSANREEAELLVSPVEVLSPLFVDGLQSIMKKTQVALFFDTYEETRFFIEPWLLSLLGGAYGDFPQNMLILIAGRHPLDTNMWAQSEPLLELLELQPLSEEECRDYLARKGIFNERRVADIVQLSRGLPIHLVSLVIGDPSDARPTDTVVDRLLRSVTAERRQVAMDAAVARLVNRDVAKVIFDNEDAFDWLRTMPFLKSVAEGWVYHPAIRQELLDSGRRESPDHQREVHLQLRSYHDRRRRELKEAGSSDEAVSHAQEELYHELCADRTEGLRSALKLGIRLWSIEPSVARKLAATLREAEQDSAVPEDEQWGVLWMRAIDELDHRHEQPAIALFDRLLAADFLGNPARVEALEERSKILRDQDRFGLALDDLEEADRLKPNDPHIHYLKARVHSEAGEAEMALEQCDLALGLLGATDPQYLLVRTLYVRIAMDVLGAKEALELVEEVLALDEYPWALTVRGELRRRLGEADKAIADFERMKELAPTSAHRAATEIGLTYAASGDSAKAIQAFKDALRAHPRCGHCWRELAYLYRAREEDGDVAQELEAVCDELGDESLHAYRGYALIHVGEEGPARRELERALEIEPAMSEGHLWLAQLLIDLEEWNDAKVHIDEALRLEPDWPRALAIRGSYWFKVEEFAMAEKDWLRVEEVSPGEIRPIGPASRGLGLARLGQYERAIAEYDKALEQEEGPEVLYNRAVAECRLRAVDSATPSIRRARAALRAPDTKPLVRMYGEAGLLALKGEAARALRLLQDATAINEKVAVEWAKTDPAWHTLRGERAFETLLEGRGTN